MRRVCELLCLGMFLTAVLSLGACDSASDDPAPAVDVSKITCGAGTLADYPECVAYGQCYGRMCKDEQDGAALEACVGTGGELAIGVQLSPACGGGDQDAITLACLTGTAQLVASGTSCELPEGWGEDTVDEQDVTREADTSNVDISSCQGPCETHMEGQCLGTD